VAAPALADGGTNPPLQFTRLWAASPTLAWGVGCTSTGAEWDGARWNARELPAGFCTLHGSSGKNVWALALPTAPSKDSAVYQFDGVNWLQRPGPTGQLWGVWALSPQDVWVSGGGDLAARFWHWTGSTWTLDEVPCPGGVDCAPDSIWARASNDVWAAADYALFHWNGTQWSAEVSPGLRVRSFVGADNELWLATSSGLLHKIR
jgi:hypothetical protein